VAETTIVFFRFERSELPVLKVIETSAQVVIVIRSERDEHLTLHREKDGALMLTHSSPDKPPSTWDAKRVEAARAVGYRNPEKHANYYTHRSLFPVIGMDGYELVARRITLAAAKPTQKYGRASRITVEAPASEFMLAFHLATIDQPYSAPDEPRVSTHLGDLYFRPAT
jgi:hypothetical protein